MAITFSSANARGITYELKLIQQHLVQHKGAEIRYFTAEKKPNNPNLNVSRRKGMKYFINKRDDIISIDGSLPSKITAEETDGATARILIAAPYDYQFRKQPKSAKKKKTFSGYTHIFTPSPFAKEFIEKYYDINESQTVVDGFCSPLASYINDSVNKESILEKLYRYYPKARGKKILSILRAGKYDEENPEEIGELDIGKFSEHLGDGWFIITNVLEILDSMALLPSSKTDSVCFIDKMIKNEELICISDALITNNSMLFSVFASKRKPLYLLEYKNKGIEQYIKKNYPSVVFKDYYKVADEIAKETFTEDMKKMCEALSYPPENQPYGEIDRLLGY